ncbi:hypothetical protein E2C01_005295 [Portunus trituberculatus]|uniref:Uncharacterized protein n=1 Tax=Portunus trituberculatus TaxID=210409 RepID=A0A5B7CS80_PORTR|nr:hypothetical protein [Portunus trituberculatus]
MEEAAVATMVVGSGVISGVVVLVVTSGIWPKTSSLTLFRPDGTTAISYVSKAELFSQTFANNSTVDDSGLVPPSAYFMPSIKYSRVVVYFHTPQGQRPTLLNALLSLHNFYSASAGAVHQYIPFTSQMNCKSFYNRTFQPLIAFTAHQQTSPQRCSAWNLLHEVRKQATETATDLSLVLEDLHPWESPPRAESPDVPILPPIMAELLEKLPLLSLTPPPVLQESPPLLPRPLPPYLQRYHTTFMNTAQTTCWGTTRITKVYWLT